MDNDKLRTNHWPQPPFPDQPQTPPGLAAEMEPTPDHGEVSYSGSGRLQGKKALITGGDSGIGRAVLSPLPAKARMLPLTIFRKNRAMRTPSSRLSSGGRTAVAIPGDIRVESFCETLVEKAVSGLGGLDIVVNNAGRQQYCEKIEQLTTADFDATFKPTSMRRSG